MARITTVASAPHSADWRMTYPVHALRENRRRWAVRLAASIAAVYSLTLTVSFTIVFFQSLRCGGFDQRITEAMSQPDVMPTADPTNAATTVPQRAANLWSRNFHSAWVLSGCRSHVFAVAMRSS